MQDHLNDELVSAYLDGELDAGERARVEHAMADSFELRELYEQLRALRSRLQSLPSHTLPAGFHQRVMQEVALRARIRAIPTAAIEPTTRSAAWRVQRRWRVAAVWAASVAAVFAAVLLLASRRQPNQLPSYAVRPIERPAVGQGEIVGPEARRDSVIRSPEPSSPLQADQLALGEATPETYVLVIDLTITPRGQAVRTFETALGKAGIRWDPAVKVGQALEESLLASRFLGDVEKAEPGLNSPRTGARARDEVEMVYVAGLGMQIEGAIADIQSRSREEIAKVRFDMAIEPKERNMFRRLDAALQLARDEAIRTPRAHRLVFRFSLRTASIGFLGTFPTPVITPQLLPEDDSDRKSPASSTPVPSAVPASPREATPGVPSLLSATPPRAAAKAVSGEQEQEALYEVLFILRNLKAMETPHDPPIAPQPPAP